MKIDLVVAINEKIFNEKPSDFLLNTEKMLRYFFRGLSKYLLNINKVFLVIPDDWEVPNWLNKDYLNILRYSELQTSLRDKEIPIDLLYYRIPGLSENYLSLDNTIFLVKSLNIERFFDNCFNTLKVKIRPEKPQSINNTQQQLYKQYIKFYDTKIDKPYILQPIHCIKPAKKSLWTAFYNQNNLTVEALIDETLTSDAYYFWSAKNNLALFKSDSINVTSYPVDSLWAGIIKYDLENNPGREVIVLDCTFTIENKLVPTANQWILEGLEARIGSNLCKFERY